MQSIALLIFCLSVEASFRLTPRSDFTEKWNNFKLSQGKRISNPKEEMLRRSIFKKNLQTIEEHNDRFRRGLETYEMGINKFADYTEEEFYRHIGGLKSFLPVNKSINTTTPDFNLTELMIPDSFDWKAKNQVTPVKDQEQCGSCWAFAVTGAIEAHYKIYNNLTVSLSEQQLVDCEYVSYGCNGGYPSYAYWYIIENGGINYDKDYPYEAYDNYCRYKSSKQKVTIKDFANFYSQIDEERLKYLIVTKGPVTAAINVVNSFAYYTGGVYYSFWCSNDPYDLNHAVVVVGYGTENGHDYWLVKNSWGTDWGLDGYIKMARNRNNHCGVATEILYPILD